MGIIVKDTGNSEFSLIEPGRYQAVCYAIWDIGLQESPWGPKAKIVVAWEIDQRINMPDSEYHGKRMVVSRFYTKSLFQTSQLREDLVSWRGKEFSDEELEGFNLDVIIGANCAIEIIHKKKKAGGMVSVVNRIGIRDRAWETMKVELPQDAPEWVTKMMDKAISPEEVQTQIQDQLEAKEYDAPDESSDEASEQVEF